MAKKRASKPKRRPSKAPAWKDRIKDLRRVKASELVAHPDNWRVHPDAQRNAFRAALTEVGWADALLVRELDDGRLQVIDGHLRREEAGDREIPVLVLDVTEEEARKILATLDPLAAMAEAEEGRLAALLAALLADLEFEDPALEELLEELLSEEIEPTELRPIDPKPPPAMSWVLVGIPTVRYGEIASVVDGLSSIEDIILETTANDG